MPILNYIQHRADCKRKQAQRAESLSSLPATYHLPLTIADKAILDTPVSLASDRVRSGEWKPIDILRSYSRRAIKSHEVTNCITESLIRDAESWLEDPSTSGINLSGPLAGIPISIKDTVNVKGHDSCIGYSKWIDKPAEVDSPMVTLLKHTGAVPFVKTNVPITLLSFESTNDVFGRTKNPHNTNYSPGGSTGGEGALLAHGGSRIGIGTDVAGSVRIPAAWSGIYALRCTTCRFPKIGNVTSMAGQEGVLAVYSPMARTLPDLIYLMKSITEIKPWEYDYTVAPIPWRWESETKPLETKRVRWGVIRDDGVVAPTPAIRRALDDTIAALKAAGDEIIELHLEEIPNMFQALRLAARLLNSDNGATFSSHFRSIFENNDAGVSQLYRIMSLPRFVKHIYSWWLRYVRRDPVLADLISDWHEFSVAEQWKMVVQRETLRKDWTDTKKKLGLDFILSPANALPSVPGGGMKYTIANCGYTFLWNIVDWAAGVVPVDHVDPVKDAVEKGSKEGRRNGVEKRAWELYDAEKMEGLPTAVQIIGGRWEEEKVLWGMERVVESLASEGKVYRGIEVEID
ncbi:acetamidase [Ascodesmis nigricans]|uniref:amidase n=1 Tax=Ascodesmis nigricans TaxID=341454 RepID=A0A4S2MVT4_9PEZI|nr:acetamidase [Ascodesmis nigricans]